MINRFSQLKQTISEEFQAAQQQKPANDPISVIERNAHLMKTESPEVESIVNGLEDDPVESKEESPKVEARISSEEGREVESNEASQTNEAEKDAHKQDTHPETNGKTSEKEDGKDPQKEPINHALQPTPENEAGLQAKLAKFAKYEEKYPQLLKAYKLEKKKGEIIKLYERVLSENTPCTSIAEPQALLDYLNDLKSRSNLQQKEVSRLQSDLDGSKKSLDQFKSNLTTAQSDLKASQAEVSKLKAEIQSLENKLANQEQKALKAAQSTQQEGESRTKLELLQSQLDAAVQARDSASKSQATLKSQFKELEIRLQEALVGTEVLRDELHEAERVSQERLHELSTVRSQLYSQEKGRRKSADETANLHSKTVEEKEQLEVEVELLNKRIIRESEQLNLQIRGLKSQLLESESHESELRKQLAQLQALHNEPRSPKRSAASSVVDLGSLVSARTGSSSALRDLPGPTQPNDVELVESRETIAATSRANDLLKQVNSDNALRIEKLQKSQRALALDLEQLRHENVLLKKQGRRGSISSAAGSTELNEEDSQKHQAYLKNVLLGFVENKGQRKALMPVIATLLGLEDSETDRFMKEFS